MDKKYWYRLDNSAMIYPMVITLESQSLFQLGAELSNPVELKTLQAALNIALVRYPYFKVELKYGLFRHYLEENKRTPEVTEYNGNLLQLINFRNNNHYLFRLTFCGNRIFLDLFHGLCDANGGMEFLKTIIYYYLSLQGKQITKQDIKTSEEAIDFEEMEDAFLKNYKPFNFRDGLKKMAGGSAYRIKGRQFLYGSLGLIQGSVPTKKLLETAHNYGCTVTAFLSALALLCAAKDAPENNKDNFVAFIPINLRKFFPSKTMSNFTIFAKCIIPHSTPKNITSYASNMSKLLKKQMELDEINTKLSFTSLMDKMKFLRYMPLILKGLISRIGRNFPGKSKQTMIISNLGIIKFGGFDYVKDFSFALNSSHKSPKNMSILSYNDRTYINFTRKVINTKLEMNFFRTLSEMGMDVDVMSNFREDCNVL